MGLEPMTSLSSTEVPVSYATEGEEECLTFPVKKDPGEHSLGGAFQLE